MKTGYDVGLPTFQKGFAYIVFFRVVGPEIKSHASLVFLSEDEAKRAVEELNQKPYGDLAIRWYYEQTPILSFQK
jgi:hypothetical protein